MQLLKIIQKITPAHCLPIRRCIVLVSTALPLTQALLYVHCLNIIIMTTVISMIIMIIIMISKIIEAISITRQSAPVCSLHH